MHRIRYVWVGLCVFLVVMNLRDLQVQFTWGDLFLAMGFALWGFVVFANAKLAWPYEAPAEYRPKVNDALGNSLKGLGMVLVVAGGVLDIFF
jgi:hypothetical protein